MDPCPFVKVLVGGLALRVPVVSKPTRAGVHPWGIPCFCEMKLDKFSVQKTVVPLVSADSPSPDVHNVAASFHLEQAEIIKLSQGSCLGGSKPRLEIAIYTGRQGSTCGIGLGKMLGKFSVALELGGCFEKVIVFHSGWVSIGKGGDSKPGTQLHLNVRAEPDPRFVFHFDGEPECSPQIFQIQDSIRQPIFSCKFSHERNSRSRQLQFDHSNRSWLGSFGSSRERDRKERKGWLIMIHDLSGYPVAAASMITPFVPSSGTDKVSRSNPGAWLILKPGNMDDSWRPWGRLEAWRERGNNEGLGFRFELLAEGGGLVGTNNGILLAESVISSQKGGKFLIDMSTGKLGTSSVNSPVPSPQSSGDFSYNPWPFPPSAYRGFVMSSTVQGEHQSSRPVVQIARRYVTCMQDAALFVALAAAVDLSMDACQLFSRKLRKELCKQDTVSYGF
ncbi:uncharacterized protein LOC131071792 [Cryptomeria japonica]|uniref:uncharacterized protein LOC131071792 n=1 Tax=Cryptomeria japonica TaxID=3369 RepID=UPI0027DA044D|nr:uncharacterized protein LOC131071792 [Cryptomeria japonica]